MNKRSREHEKPRKRPKYIWQVSLIKVAFKNDGGNIGYLIRRIG